MSRTWHSLLIAALVLLRPVFSTATTSQYETAMVNLYCQSGGGNACNVYWPMDETSGTTLVNQCPVSCGAHSPPLYDLTTHNTPTLNQSGVNSQHGPSVLFTGASSQYAENNANDTGTGPSDMSNGNVTSGCWFKQHVVGAATLLSVNTFGANGNPGVNNMNWALFINNEVIFAATKAGGGTYVQVIGGTTPLIADTWYFFVNTWRLSNTTDTVYLNGTADGNNGGVVSAPAPSATEFMDLAVRSFTTDPIYATAYESDCFIFKTLWEAPTVKFFYDIGTVATDDWPYNVKAPQIPKFRNKGYEKKLVDYGYTTGLFATRTLKPPLFGLYPALATVPSGNIR